MRLVLGFFLMFLAHAVFAQSGTDQQLIASSQTGASTVFFKARSNTVISLGNYADAKEINVRRGLPFFFAKANRGERLKVAYIGGSITRANDQYRNQSLDFIQQMYPSVELLGINAGVSGTDADLGACRLADQVLKYNPDLIFIEFAVNGGFPQGMEGMVRQIIKSNKQTDICFIYTVTSPQLIYYQQNEMPAGIKLLEEIAEHYQIPSVHLGMEAASLEKQGKLLAKGKLGESTIPAFSADGVHPTLIGGDLYAASIARAMIRMKDFNQVLPYELKIPIYPDNWENAKMLAPDQIGYSKGWQKIDPSSSNLKTYKSWFPYLLTSEQSGESLTFKYKGTAFGLFDIGAPEAGQMDLYVDGKLVNLIPLKADRLFSIDLTGTPEPLKRFNAYCNNRTRGQYFLVQTSDGGTHTVTLSIAAEKPDKKKILGPNQQTDITKDFEKYNHNQIYIGKILLLGDLVK